MEINFFDRPCIDILVGRKNKFTPKILSSTDSLYVIHFIFLYEVFILITMISFQEVDMAYPKGTPVFRSLNLDIAQGEFVVITGTPGSGKTTFLKLILKETTPSEGAIYFQGEDITKFGAGKLKKYRQSIGSIFQDFKLLPNKTAFENIAFPLEVFGYDDDEIQKDTIDVLDIVGMAHRKNHFPKELSGGEKQKIAIARAMVSRPLLILADEPTGSLDENTAKEIIQILKAINSLGTTVVMTTHTDRLIAPSKNIRKLHIKEGGVIQDLGRGVNLSKDNRN